MALNAASEVGMLRRVIVHRPGLEHQRLTPANAADLLFDDVIWVKQAKAEHDQFVEVMRDRGVEVLYAEELLTDVLAIDEARDWIVDQVLNERHVGLRLARSRRDWARTASPAEVADYLIGGMTKEDLEDGAGLKYDASVSGDLLVPPLPNFMFQRDPSSWIFGGVTLNPMAKPARRPETVFMEAIYRHHPVFAGEDFRIWYGGVETDCEVDLTLHTRWGALPARIELSRTRQLRGTVRVVCEQGALELANLTWVLHNVWLHWRHSLDDRLLRERLFPWLRASVNAQRAWLARHGLVPAKPEPVERDLAEYAGHYTASISDLDLALDGDALVVRTSVKPLVPGSLTTFPDPEPSRLRAYAPDRLVGIAGPLSGARAEAFRAPDGRVAWLRLGGRVRRKVASG